MRNLLGGGLFTSTLLTLVLLPTLYAWLETRAERRETALSTRDRVVGYTPQVRVDILLEEGDINNVLQALRTADCGLRGRGIFWVTQVEQQGAL